jgi:DNA repair exonuclease SbcCD ATPase subunit
MENELQQRLEQAMDERRRLEELVDSVRKNAESERQQQLKAFHDEIAQLKVCTYIFNIY